MGFIVAAVLLHLSPLLQLATPQGRARAGSSAVAAVASGRSEPAAQS